MQPAFSWPSNLPWGLGFCLINHSCSPFFFLFPRNSSGVIHNPCFIRLSKLKLQTLLCKWTSMFHFSFNCPLALIRTAQPLLPGYHLSKGKWVQIYFSLVLLMWYFWMSLRGQPRAGRKLPLASGDRQPPLRKLVPLLPFSCPESNNRRVWNSSSLTGFSLSDSGIW